MNKIILTLGIIIFLIGNVNSQNNTWNWANELTSSGLIGGLTKINDDYSYILSERKHVNN